MTRGSVDTRSAGTETGGWGPTVSGGGRRGRRWPRRVATTLGVLVLVVALAGAGLLGYAWSQIRRVPVSSLQSGGGPMHVLVVGSDSREDLTEEQRRELNTGSAGGNRTDTIFLMTISGGRVGLLAFPRDLYVTRCDGSEGRINAALAIGGRGCLAQTVSQVSGISIDHYLEVDFLGFRGIVNAVGGVRVCLDQPIADADAGIDLPAGCQTLDGANALGYVRVRKIDNDLERIKRQQKFLRALVGEVVDPATLVNVPRLFSTAGRAGRALTSDRSLGPIDLARLGFGMRGLATGELVTETVPVEGATIGGAAVLLPVEGQAQPLFAAFRDGSILARVSEGPAPADIQVAVLNGAGVANLAGDTADTLEAAGFQIARVGNSDPVEQTQVAHPPGAAAEAAVVADALSTDAELREDTGVATVTVILGRDLADRQ